MNPKRRPCTRKISGLRKRNDYLRKDEGCGHNLQDGVKQTDRLDAAPHVLPIRENSRHEITTILNG